VLVFWSPVTKTSWINAVFLFFMVMAYYLSITAYCTPYNALIPELGHTQQERLNISTVISFTFIAGTAMAYLAPMIWGAFIPAFGRVGAIRITFTGMAVIAFFCMLVPVFTIHEKDYVNTVPTNDTAFRSLAATFGNGEFRKFVASDILYWIALTMFQTGLPFFVTSLLKLPETMTTLYFVGMTALSLVFYIPINKLAPRLGKKKLILIAFAIFGCSYFYTGFMGRIPVISPTIQGLILTVVAALPMAIFGILPQAVVADIAQSDANTSGTNREGMFYAARTFAFKLGQSLAMLIFTAVSTIGTQTGLGYRIAAFGAALFCLLGGVVFAFYNERRINRLI
jgi:Na+/melibiose symporter-like transporter